jgi:dihydroorotate dehydrogenase electron transfer subunit
MPAPPPDARSARARVARVTPCGDDGVILALRLDEPLPPVRASRFFMLKRVDRLSPLLPRPFSIYRQHGAELEFLIKVIGRGTQALACSRVGDEIAWIGPLGNGWPTLDGVGPPWVMLAGGVGSAPFYMAIEQALAGMDGARACRPERLTLLYGAARRGLLYDLEAFRALGAATWTATDDGSHGFRGNVVRLLESLWAEERLPAHVRLLACGPDRMLESVEDLARARGLACWLSLETVMGCGVGICNGCPVPTRPEGPLGAWPNAKCCVEGPVFASDAITLHGPGAPHGTPSRRAEPRAEPAHEPVAGRAGN